MSKKSEQKKLKTPDVIEVKGTELLDKMISNKKPYRWYPGWGFCCGCCISRFQLLQTEQI